jgi:hypothetical protein
MQRDFALLVIVTLIVFLVRDELRHRLGRLRSEILARLAKHQPELGDFQFQPKGSKLEIRHLSDLIAELEEGVFKYAALPLAARNGA